MSSLNRHHGVDKNADLDPELLRRETRPLRVRIHEVISDVGWGILGMLGMFTFMMPEYTDLFFIFGMFFWLYARNKRLAYPFCTPIVEQVPNSKKKGKMGDGIMYMGNDIVDGAEVWFSDDNLRTHVLIFGSTGSGKTRSLLGLLYQALLFGSGCIYVDGKGDNTVYWLVWSICRRLGREDDLLVINYLTGGAENASSSPDRLSNTTNPFANGTSDQLRELVVGLMRDSGGDGDMWKGRASALLAGLLRCLVALRDRGEIQLNVQTIRDQMPLDKVIELTRRTDLSDYSILPLRKYLLELPGFTEEDALAGDIAPKAYEQHGYLTMQLTETLGDLGDTYGHIFRTPLGEVDFKDVVFNRRILFVMLPALEKSPDSLGNLGKLVVASVRSALAPALGNKLEGSRRDVIEVKPTTADVPFLLVLDEYGYYSVKGFAVVAAQARSLGVSVFFAGQDYPSFKKGSVEEAASVVANTNIKICMKLEDPDETFQLFEKRAGKSNVTMTTGHEMRGALVDYQDQNTTRIEEKMRINVRDLVSQKPGQAHVLFGDTVVRCQMFYAEPYEVESARLNAFLPVKGPSKSTLDSIQGVFDKLDSLFDDACKKHSDKTGFPYHPRSKKKSSIASGAQGRRRLPPKSKDSGLMTFLDDFKLARKNKDDMMNSGVFAIGMIEYRNTVGDEELIKESGHRRKEMQSRADAERDRLVSNKDKSLAIDDGDYKAIERAKEDASKVMETAGLIDELDDPVKRVLEGLELAQTRANDAVTEAEDAEKRKDQLGDEEKKHRHENESMEEEEAQQERVTKLEEEETIAARRKENEETDMDDWDELDPENTPDYDPRKDGIMADAQDFSKLFEGVINRVVTGNAFSEEEAVSPSKLQEITARRQLKAIEVALGRNDDEADEQAEIGMQMLSNTVFYPKTPTPTKESLRSVEDNMRALRRKLDDMEPGM